MNYELMREVESTFDPTDADAAQQLTYKCLSLMAVCVRVLWAQSNGMKIGRDDSATLNSRMIDMALTLRLLKWDWMANDLNILYERLDPIWKSNGTTIEPEAGD